MQLQHRCGVCGDCRYVESTRRLVLVLVSDHLRTDRDGPVNMWNQALRENPCVNALYQGENI